MAPMFREDDPLAQNLLSDYRETWSALSPDLRARLRTGVDELDAGDVAQLMVAPHPLVSLSFWADRPEDASWNLAHTFAEWASREAPPEEELG